MKFTFYIIISLLLLSCRNKSESETEVENQKTSAPVVDTLDQDSSFNSSEKYVAIPDTIQIKNPQAHELISSPLLIKGKARGYWFFEGQAPFRLLGADGEVLAEGSITATENWMTEDFVPFEASVSFKAPKEKRGQIIFNRANASGLPEHDRSIAVPVLFSKAE